MNARKIYRVLMVILLLGMCLFLVWLQGQASQAPELEGSKLPWVQCYRSVFFYLVLGILVSLREHSRVRELKAHPVLWKQGRVQGQFLLIFDLLLGAAWAFWGYLKFRPVADGDSLWSIHVHAGTCTAFSGWFLLLFLVWYLHGCWPALKREWCCDRPVWAKILLSGKALLFDAIARGRIGLEKILRAGFCLWGLGLVAGKLWETLVLASESTLRLWVLSDLGSYPVENWGLFAVGAVVWLVFLEKDGLEEVAA